MSSDPINKKQQLLLEYLLSDRTVFIKCVRIAKPSYFEAPLDRVTETICEYFEKHHQIPSVDIIEAETGILLKEREMDEGEFSYFLDEFESHCKEGAMTNAILSSVDLINDGNHAGVQDLVREAMMVKIDNTLGTDLFEDPEERITNTNVNVDERSMGIDALDEITSRVRRGELGMFFASTAGGKSVTLANIARNMSLQKLDVLVISLELNEALYAKRLDSIVSGYSIADHLENAANIAEFLKVQQGNMGRIIVKKLPYGSSPADVRAVVMEYHLKYGKYPDVLEVDYLGLMGGTKTKGMNKFDEDELKAFGIRDICVDFDMYGFSAGQVNRDGYDVRTLGPQHVAGGISVINACDWAVGLVATEEDIDNNQVQGVQMKVRNGGKTIHPVILYRCPKTLRISDKPFIGKITDSPVKNLGKKKQEAKKDSGPPEVVEGGRNKLQAILNRKNRP